MLCFSSAFDPRSPRFLDLANAQILVISLIWMKKLPDQVVKTYG